MKSRVLGAAVTGGLAALALQVLLVAPCPAGAVGRTAPATLPAAGARGDSATLQKLTASDGAAGDGFGYALAVDGDTAVVGAELANSGQGAAYVYVLENGAWTQQQKLTVGGLNANAYFGDSVAVSGDTIVVGAGQQAAAGAYSGAVYVFTRSGTTWSLQQTLTASDEAALWHFGDTVALDGDTLVVAHTGAPPNARGGAYVFTRSGGTWYQQAELLPSGANDYENMGMSLAISGDTVVAGSPGHDVGNAQSAGAVYVFTGSGATWSQQACLTESDPANVDELGQSVAIHGDTVVSGAIYNGGHGAAYVFTRTGTTWAQAVKFVGPLTSNNYGHTVAADGPLVVVGSAANSADVWTDFSSGWQKTGTVTDPSGSGGGFGESVALSGTTALFGAQGSSGAAGAAWAGDVGSCLVRVTPSGVPSWWTNQKPVDVTLTAETAAQGATVSAVEQRPYEQGAWSPCAGPLTFADEGSVTWQYRATDSAGHTSDPGFFVVAVDTRPPSTKAFASATCKHGKTASLKYQVIDPVPGSEGATVTVKVTKGKKLVKQLRLGDQPANKKLTAKFTCKLAKGKYTFTVYAKDLAGNVQTKAGHNTLTVT